MRRPSKRPLNPTWPPDPAKGNSEILYLLPLDSIEGEGGMFPDVLVLREGNLPSYFKVDVSYS